MNYVAFSPDGKTLMTGSWDKTARLWNVQTGAEIRTFPQSGVVAGLAFSHTGNQVLITSCKDPSVTGYCPDRIVKLYEVATGEEIRSFTSVTSDLTFLRFPVFSPDDKWVLCSAREGAILWDTHTGREIRRFIGHTDFVLTAVFSPDGQWVLTGSADKTARLWDANTGKEIRVFDGHLDPVDAASFSSDGKMVLTASDDGTARLWDVQTGKEVQRFTGHAGQVWASAMSADGKWVVTGGDDYTARLWDAQTGQELRRFVGHTSGIEVVAISPDGKYVATASDDYTARLWPTDYHEVVNYLCDRLERDFTDQERAQYGIHDKKPTCHAKP